jgi:hypothetical protein
MYGTPMSVQYLPTAEYQPPLYRKESAASSLQAKFLNEPHQRQLETNHFPTP